MYRIQRTIDSSVFLVGGAFVTLLTTSLLAGCGAGGGNDPGEGMTGEVEAAFDVTPPGVQCVALIGPTVTGYYPVPAGGATLQITGLLPGVTTLGASAFNASCDS